ncbi:hypothetical protein Trydic_g23284 [Trypoxylus dichotomus]
MDLQEILGTKDQTVQEVIRKQLREHLPAVEKLISSFQNWLKSGTYLPKNIDKSIIVNYLRFSDYNLELAKRKFEDWILTMYKFKNITFASLDYGYFQRFERTFFLCPKLTPECNRIGFMTIPEDVNDFDFQKIFNYLLALIEFLTIKDECAGYISIYDFANLTPEHLAKVNAKLLSEAVNFMFNIYPVKIRQSHFINVPYIPETFISTAKSSMDENILKTMVIHKKPVDLTRLFPKECLPAEYGGSPNLKIDDIVEKQNRYMFGDAELARQRESLNLAADLPQDKRQQHSFEDFELGYISTQNDD